MKILIIADNEINEWWDRIPGRQDERLEDVDLILSAGDLAPAYLEFLVTMTNVPLLYIRGNHDSIYDTYPPQGCIPVDDKIAEVYYDMENGSMRAVRVSRSRRAADVEKDVLTQLMPAWQGEIPGQLYGGSSSSGKGGIVWGGIPLRERFNGKLGIIRIAGLGGSMRYRKGRDMYTEAEMAKRVKQIERRLKYISAQGRILDAAPWKLRGGNNISADNNDISAAETEAGAIPFSKRRPMDILLTHAPCRRYGDMEDLPHRGFECFNAMLDRWQPKYHFYGHVHKEYGSFERELIHPSGTTLINACGYSIIEI